MINPPVSTRDPQWPPWRGTGESRQSPYSQWLNEVHVGEDGDVSGGSVQQALLEAGARYGGHRPQHRAVSDLRQAQSLRHL